MRTFTVGLGITVSLVVAGCGDSSKSPIAPVSQVPSLDGGAPRTCTAPDAGEAGTPLAAAPLYHRASSGCCPGDRAAGDAFMTGNEGECMKDSDCTAGIDGRCTASQTFACSYDDCFSDGDCAPHVPCACRSSSASQAPNSCLTGSDCAVDSECGPAGYCSPSPSPAFGCAFDYPPAYHCHTAADECQDDRDCASFDAGLQPGTNLCLYDGQTQRWACGNLACTLP